jgi:cysteine/O-acetylserine efflux protein
VTTKLFPLITFILISTFTPGPSNISSASVALVHGYKKTLIYQAGLASGVFLLMLISGLFSTILLNIFPALEPIMRYVGAGYILYLAYGTLKTSYSFTDDRVKPLGFINGFLLQILNPKLFVYAFTLFSTFLASISGMMSLLLLACVLLTATSFCATSLWALLGTVIKNYLHNTLLKTTVNIILSLLLVYTAFTLIDVIH